MASGTSLKCIMIKLCREGVLGKKIRCETVNTTTIQLLEIA